MITEGSASANSSGSWGEAYWKARAERAEAAETELLEQIERLSAAFRAIVALGEALEEVRRFKPGGAIRGGAGDEEIVRPPTGLEDRP